jgi:hypothetical protein
MINCAIKNIFGEFQISPSGVSITAGTYELLQELKFRLVVEFKIGVPKTEPKFQRQYMFRLVMSGFNFPACSSA